MIWANAKVGLCGDAPGGGLAELAREEEGLELEPAGREAGIGYKGSDEEEATGG